MEKRKVRDFLNAVQEEGVQAVLESDRVPEIVTSLRSLMQQE